MPEGRRERRRVEMRERLLSSALHLFAAQGFEATTIDQIAEHADVARQTVLNHYPAKRDFVRAWGERRRRRLDTAGGSPGDDGRDDGGDHGGVRAGLHRLYRVLAEINEEERALTRTINHIEQLVDEERPVPEVLLRVLTRARDDGHLVATPAVRTVAEILTAVYFDTVARWLVSEQPPFDLGGELVTRIDAVLSGVVRDDRAPRD